MHIKNAMIEDLSFVPRVIPLSLTCPVIKIACGSKFAVAITKVFYFTILILYLCISLYRVVHSEML
jgi:hypothetical protein